MEYVPGRMAGHTGIRGNLKATPTPAHRLKFVSLGPCRDRMGLILTLQVIPKGETL